MATPRCRVEHFDRMRNWRGDKGLQDVFSFRSDSRGYLNAKQLTEEAFVLDILQACANVL